MVYETDHVQSLSVSCILFCLLLVQDGKKGFDSPSKTHAITYQCSNQCYYLQMKCTHLLEDVNAKVSELLDAEEGYNMNEYEEKDLILQWWKRGRDIFNHMQFILIYI